MTRVDQSYKVHEQKWFFNIYKEWEEGVRDWDVKISPFKMQPKLRLIGLNSVPMAAWV